MKFLWIFEVVFKSEKQEVNLLLISLFNNKYLWHNGFFAGIMCGVLVLFIYWVMSASR